MQDLLHSRFFPFSVFVVITDLAVVLFQFYLSESTQTENTDSNKSYSFEVSGQLKLLAESNAVSDKSAEELQLSGIDIMKQPNAIIEADPIEPKSMTQV